MPTATKLPAEETRESIAWRETQTFLANHNFLPCKENAAILNDYLQRHNLEVTYPNLKQAYEELMESGQLHVTAPDPRQVGGVDPHRKPAKPKIALYKGSHYDKTEINRLKAQIAVMSASEIKEFLAVNQWADWPFWLKGS